MYSCGKPVQHMVTTAGQVLGCALRFVAGRFGLGKTSSPSPTLYHFCTQLVHTAKCKFTSVFGQLYPLSTAPTITITIYI
jgi:hypothetical protein